MAIHFYCPLGHRLAVPDDRAGKKGRCPVCHQKVIAPVADPRAGGREKEPSPLKPPVNEFEIDDVVAQQLGLKKPE